MTKNNTSNSSTNKNMGGQNYSNASGNKNSANKNSTNKNTSNQNYSNTSDNKNKY